MKMVIYVHIPFCVKKCYYCDFLSSPANKETIDKYIKALINEIEYYGRIYGKKGSKETVSSVFFGGGTPSILEGIYIEEIMNKLKELFYIEENAEITIECNPGTANEDKLRKYIEVGINRLSIGLQSANDEELRSVGRIHTYSEFLDVYKLARKVGFNNINIDLMSALPNQTLDSYKDTLDKVVELAPEHISAYSLILEEGTCLYEKIEELEKAGKPTGLPDEETERNMYYETKRILEEKGYYRYEISNYAKSGYECRHNMAYWEREDYIGIGIGAASLLEGIRTKNICDINEYIVIGKEPNSRVDSSETEVLTKEDKMAEFMFLGLRMVEGVSTKEFYEEFGEDFDTIYGGITQKHIKEGLLVRNGENIRLTELGMDVSNVVMSSYILC